MEQAKNTKYKAFIGILIFLIINEKEIYSIIQKKRGERSRKGRYKKRKIKKKGIQERNGKQEN